MTLDEFEMGTKQKSKSIYRSAVNQDVTTTNTRIIFKMYQNAHKAHRKKGINVHITSTYQLIMFWVTVRYMTKFSITINHNTMRKRSSTDPPVKIANLLCNWDIVPNFNVLGIFLAYLILLL